MKIPPAIVWYRLDLRLQDNPALQAAIKRRGSVVPVYIWDEAGEESWAPGGASRWWLHHSLASLDGSLRRRGSRLVLMRGESLRCLRTLARDTGASAVYWNRRHEPGRVTRDRMIEATLQRAGLEVRTFNGALLFEPSKVRTKSGRQYQVFTPFWRRCRELMVAAPQRLRVGRLTAPGRWPRTLAIEELRLLSEVRWDAGLAAVWRPGEAAARRCLRLFVAQRLKAYDAARDRPDVSGTSGLSPHLHFGEISPRQVWAAVNRRTQVDGGFSACRGALVFRKEIGWREFAYHLLWHFPRTPEEPLRGEFQAFPWRNDAAALGAWQRGQTGFPIVDAGMRQLWRTGWIPNRVRMIVASFLVKDLLISWQIGAAWFWDTLVDADLANNTLGWQWVAGCGADAAPYFRVFNPVTQARMFDPDGDYVRRWVPELARLPAGQIQTPWEASRDLLAAAGVKLGETYPRPIVEHAAAREAALEAYGIARRGLRRGDPDRDLEKLHCRSK